MTRTALVVRGGWDGHFPVEATERFIPFLKEHDFDVTVSEDLDVYLDRDRLAATDLILQCWTMGEITLDHANNLADAVAGGTGLAGWHGGIVDAFRGSLIFQHLTGGKFLDHPAEYVDYRLSFVPARADHPIVAGLGDVDLTHTEKYWVLTDAHNDVLATVEFEPDADEPDTPWRGDVVMPAVWTRGWGRGRVFVSTVGHAPTDLDVPEIRALTERGLLWASR